MISFSLYNKYIIRIHLFEKLVAYYLFNNIICTSTIHFTKCIFNYTNKSILQGKKKKFLILYLLYAFFLEKLSCYKAIANYARNSISDFGINIGQLLGFSVILRNNDMYSFLCQYIYNSICNEKGFDGLILNKVLFNRFGSLNFVIRNLYVFSEIDLFFEQMHEFFPSYQLNMNINIYSSTRSIIGILLYCTHLQIPFNYMIYYNCID